MCPEYFNWGNCSCYQAWKMPQCTVSHLEKKGSRAYFQIARGLIDWAHNQRNFLSVQLCHFHFKTFCFARLNHIKCFQCYTWSLQLILSGLSQCVTHFFYFLFFKPHHILSHAASGKWIETFVRLTYKLGNKARVLPEVLPCLYGCGEAQIRHRRGCCCWAVWEGEIQVKLPRGRVFYALAEWEHARLTVLFALPLGFHQGPSLGQHECQILLRRAQTIPD